MFEGRISLAVASEEDKVSGISTLTKVDMAASKLLANSDRWSDDSVFSRDLIDLAMLELPTQSFREAIAKALKSGQLSGYAGDVWFPQPAPNDHVWRSMPNHGMTPHTSGTSLSAQARYAAGVREILECFFDKKPIRDPYLIIKDGQLAGMGAHSYSKGSATGGSEEAVKYKKK